MSAPTIDPVVRERRAGMFAIATAAPVALAIWLAIDLLMAPLTGMESLAARLIFTAKCCCVATLFGFVLGIEAVAHERLVSPAFDPLVGYETRRLRVNLRYLQNTLEQLVVFVAALIGLTLYSPDGSAMRAVVATTVVWILARFAFWIGYHRSAAMRGLGAPGVAMTLLILIYVVGRFGLEIAGLPGAIALLAIFLLIEAYLFWATRDPVA